jgi:hypothetical protein
VAGTTVTFQADSSEATFINGATTQTDANGTAFKTVEVTAVALRPTITTLNIGASATVGNQEAFNLITLFLEPVFVESVTLSANPITVQTGDASTITAFAATNTGRGVPSGTTINFAVDKGGIEPFAQTDDNGVAQAQFTAPPLPGTATVTASVGGKSGSTTVTVIASDLAITPSSVTILSGGTAIFTVSGGVAPYAITSSSPNAVPFPTTVQVSGGTFNVPIGPGAPAQTITFTALDRAGNRATATLTVQETPTPEPPEPPAVLVVTPTSAPNTICSSTVTQSFVITGGTPPYTVTPSVSIVTVVVTGGVFTVVPTTPLACNIVPVGGNQTVNLIVSDGGSPAQTATANITITHP